VNLTALPSIVPPVMKMYGDIPQAQGLKFIGKGANLYGRYKLGHTEAGAKIFKTELTNEEKWVFDEITRKGWAKSQFNREALAALESKVSGGAKTTVEVLMSGFGISEEINRAATIMGAYKGVREYKKLGKEESLKLAKEISDNAHSVYNKANRPAWARGGGVGGNIALAFYVFKNFAHNYALTMKDAWGSSIIPEHKAALAWLSIAPAVIGGSGLGAGAVVFSILKALDMGDDPEEDFYDWIKKHGGAYGERIARHGLVGMAGINLKGSLSLGITDLVPTSIPELLGAPGSMLLEDPKYMLESFKRGATLKAIEKLPVMPLFLANPIKGYREWSEGVTTFTNSPVFFGDQPLMADNVDFFLRFFSFNPSRISGIREKQWKERLTQDKYRKWRTRINAKLRKYYAKPTREGQLDIMKEIEEFNAKAASAIEKGLASKITKKSMKSIKKSKPPKVERLRRK
jgi:hypothetical protein